MGGGDGGKKWRRYVAMVGGYQVTKRRSDIREKTVNHEEKIITSGKMTVNQRG